MAYMEDQANEREQTRQRLLAGKPQLQIGDPAGAAPSPLDNMSPQDLASIFQTLEHLGVGQARAPRGISEQPTPPLQAPQVAARVSAPSTTQWKDDNSLSNIAGGFLGKAGGLRDLLAELQKRQGTAAPAAPGSARLSDMTRRGHSIPQGPSPQQLVPGLQPGLDATKAPPGAAAAEAYQTQHTPGPGVTGTAQGAGYKSDLDYLNAHGAHSSVLQDGKIVSVPAGTPGNYEQIHPEFAARLHAAGEAYEKATGKPPQYGEMTRGADVQKVYYDKYQSGQGGIAASPGHSHHQVGTAGDLPDSGFRQWLKAGNQDQFGLRFPVHGDEPHVEMNPTFKSSLASQAPAGSQPPAWSGSAPAQASPGTNWPAASSTTAAKDVPTPQAGSRSLTSSAQPGTGGVPPELVDWVAKKENFTPNAFADYGTTNIGYGTAANGRTSITEPEARAEMTAELGKHLATIDALNPNTPPAIRNSLASLQFNTGGKALQGSGLADAVKAGDWGQAEQIFRQYTKAGGQPLHGLDVRRQQEAQAFKDPNFYKSNQGTTAAQDWGGQQQGVDAVQNTPVTGQQCA